MGIELQKLLGHAPGPESEPTLRRLQFYRMAVELEQLKEPDAKVWFEMPWQDWGTGPLFVRYADNEDFAEACVTDRANRFPKDVCVAMFATSGDGPKPLFNCVHAFADIKDDDPRKEDTTLWCPLSDFSVNLSVASEMEIGDDAVERLNGFLQGCEASLGGLRELMYELFGDGVQLLEMLKVALSSKNPSLSQLVSELNALGREPGLSGILGDFLRNAHFDNTLNAVEPESLVPLAAMDDAQRRAVAAALGNRVSVVTGPPGCGKTQVILNLLANAVVQGKSVLVASKNNKAVDNVRDRLCAQPGLEHALVRFGSRSVRDSQTIPGLDALLNIAQRVNADAARRERVSAKDIHARACAEQKMSRGLIARREELRRRLPGLHQALADSVASQNETRERGDAMMAAFCSENVKQRVFDAFAGSELDDIAAPIRMARNVFAGKYSGLGRLWIDWFTKRKHAAVAVNGVMALPSTIRRHVEECVGRRSAEDFRKGGAIAAYYRDVDSVLADGERYLRERAELEERLAFENSRAEARVAEAQTAYAACENELDAIAARNPEAALARAQRAIGDNAARYVAAELSARLSAAGTAATISDFKGYIVGGIPWKYEELSRFRSVVRRFLQACPLVAVTSLSAKSAIPLDTGLFDMLVIDEASQCDVASALPLMFRAKQVVVIGDPMQLRHISAVNADEEDAIRTHLRMAAASDLQYAEMSLWDRCRDWLTHAEGLNSPLMLNGHYRCHPDIIEYSNRNFYADMGGLVVKTGEFAHPLRQQGCFWLNIRGRQTSSQVNVNMDEVRAAIAKAVALAKAYPSISIGLVTPFKAQAERLHHAIPPELAPRITASTVHKFQGDERDVMIYSLVVTDNSPVTKIRWIDEGARNLVNVAVTRARQALYVVGNRDYIQSNSSPGRPLGALLRHCRTEAG